ncbi:MAG: PAS domain S-box protein [Gemmatimonadales bacterium]
MPDGMMLPLRSKIAAGLFTAVLVLVVGVISFLAVSRAAGSFEEVNHVSLVLLEQQKLVTGLDDAETAARGFAITGDASFLGPYEAARTSVPRSINRLRALTSDHPSQQQRLNTLESVAGDHLKINDQIIRMRSEKGFSAAQELIQARQGKQVMDHARAITSEMEREENKLLALRAKNQKSEQLIAYLVIGIGSLIAFLLSIMINWAIRSDVIESETQREMIERQSRQLRKQSDEQTRLTREMSALLESTEAGFYGMSVAGDCTFVNRAGAALLGFTVAELIGRNVHQTIHHHRADGRPYPVEECSIYEAARKGVNAASENEVFWRKDGSPVTVEFSSSPIIYAGEHRGAVVAFADISQRLLAQRAIAESEGRKAAILRSTLDSIISMDNNGSITEFNRAAETTFGFTRDEVMGKRLADLIVPDRYRDAHMAGLKRFLQTGEAHVIGKRLELPAIRKDGSEFQSELTITRSDSEGLPSFTGVLRDITERKRSEAEREQLIKALARSNQELDQFAYVASHDLKAPLRGIANLSQWIEEDLGERLGGENKSQMEMLRGRVHRMESLIDGILQYSRAGRVKAKPESIDTGELVKEVVDLMSPPPGTRVQVEPGMPTVLAEKVPLQQVFMNLIGNAIKHTGKENPLIEVSWSDAELFYEFSVRDNGQGIAPQYHDRIFGIFQTLEARDTVEGTGIGLSVVQKIVETKGGRVWVESSVGKGASFKFRWPKVEIVGA